MNEQSALRAARQLLEIRRQEAQQAGGLHLRARWVGQSSRVLQLSAHDPRGAVQALVSVPDYCTEAHGEQAIRTGLTVLLDEVLRQAADVPPGDDHVRHVREVVVGRTRLLAWAAGPLA